MLKVGDRVMVRPSAGPGDEVTLGTMRLDKDFYIIDEVSKDGQMVHLEGTPEDDWYTFQFLMNASEDDVEKIE